MTGRRTAEQDALYPGSLSAAVEAFRAACEAVAVADPTPADWREIVAAFAAVEAVRAPADEPPAPALPAQTVATRPAPRRRLRYWSPPML